MADEKQLEILKSGVKEWNAWRETNPDVEIDLIATNLSGANLKFANFISANLSFADLSGANLSNANLRVSNLRSTNFCGANLSYASLRVASLNSADLSFADLSSVDLSYAELSYADLKSTNLTLANLNSANLSKSNLKGAKLNSANLNSANLTLANLSDADLKSASLIRANLRAANLSYANLRAANLKSAHLKSADLIGANLSVSTLNKIDFSQVIFGNTHFAKTNLSEALHLDDSQHKDSSSIDHTTLAISGELPEAFLKGCGLSDWEIEQAKLFQPTLSNFEINDIIYRIYDIRATQSIQIAPMFISYTHANSNFVDKIGELLTWKGIRYWRDIHEMKAGRLEKQVDHGMRLNDLVLIVLSKESVESDWVEHEVKKARRFEKEAGKDVMVPIALDGAWRTCKWPTRLREQIEEYQVLDFSEWQDEEKLRKQFANLLNGIDLFYK